MSNKSSCICFQASKTWSFWCRIEVLREALKTKSQWWRKCPIQVAHPERRLLHSEASFALFAEGSAAKEQWYAALRQAAGSAPSRQAIEDAYTQFCDQARGSGALLRYPQVSSSCRATALLPPAPQHILLLPSQAFQICFCCFSFTLDSAC